MNLTKEEKKILQRMGKVSSVHLVSGGCKTGHYCYKNKMKEQDIKLQTFYGTFCKKCGRLVILDYVIKDKI